MELEKGITRNGEGFAGVRWNILGQSYFPKAVCDSAFAFETNSDPGQFVPVHIHPTQDEFILVQEGELSLKLDGVWSVAKAGDLVRMPRGIPSKVESSNFQLGDHCSQRTRHNSRRYCARHPRTRSN
jgi:quercetin dioxygenase-like cupin family protein